MYWLICTFFNQCCYTLFRVNKLFKLSIILYILCQPWPWFPHKKASWAWYFLFGFLVKLMVSNFHYNMEILGGALNLVYTAKIRLLCQFISQLFLTKFYSVYSCSARLLYFKEVLPLRSIRPSLQCIAEGAIVLHLSHLPLYSRGVNSTSQNKRW